ncbi:MAG: PadR family transcriptional regulator [Clostridia bacterium]|nr:PadR family transcriptional regulator [Clostridia bacterium]
MDAQLKKGFLEVCVLAALRNKDLYGYKLIEDISKYIDISESTLYPILKRLENSGCLTTYTQEHNSRLRKYYSITSEGKKHIIDFLSSKEEIMKIYDFIKGENEIE